MYKTVGIAVQSGSANNTRHEAGFLFFVVRSVASGIAPKRAAMLISQAFSSLSVVDAGAMPVSCRLSEATP